MSAGRPTLYKPEYCKKLIDHMAEGLSFESFAGVVGVNRDTVHEWAKVHEEFSEAKSIGLEKNRLWWEKQGAKGMWAGKQFNSTVFVFNMKNRFPKEWRDKVEVSGDPDNPLKIQVEHKAPEDMTEDELRDAIKSKCES